MALPRFNLSHKQVNLASTANSSRTYEYNAQSQLLSVDHGNTATYLYDAMDQRVYKGTPTGTTDYVYFNGQPVAEKDQNGAWTDYVYANGRKIASVAGQEKVLRIQGFNTAAGQYTWFNMPTLGDVPGYVIQSGDLLVFRQRTHGQAQGGISFNTDTYGNPSFQTIGIAQDTDGGYINEDPWSKDVWHNRVVPISMVAGNHVSVFTFGCDGNASAGAWYIDFADVAIVSPSTGAVHPIFTGAQSVAAFPYYPFVNSDPSQALSSVLPVANPNFTRYYLDDHLGTAQMELSSDGWPVWQGQFTPFGQELPDGNTALHYKFTGKERDNESGLDYFGARYYASSMGRWMSPDWAAKAIPVPYAKLDNPQSLNLYAYVGNNPLSRRDPDGHYECGGSKEQCAAVKSALDVVRRADANLKEGSKERTRLDKVLSFYGAEGQKNGVNVNFGKLDGAVAQTSTSSFLDFIRLQRSHLIRVLLQSLEMPDRANLSRTKELTVSNNAKAKQVEQIHMRGLFTVSFMHIRASLMWTKV